jgi:lipopolysaccharide/colanic/teichoic acid biosynthesis glycosyltransferase
MANSEEGRPVRLVAGLAADYRASAWSLSVRKRLLDLGAAAFLLIMAAPVIALFALAVKLSSQGPALFRQRRPGRGGVEFNILKFRTMVENAPARGPAMTRSADPRVTSLGRFMRRWKFDELPQLFNVLRGEMSFVGPRPLPRSHWHMFSVPPDQLPTHTLRPGITSAATLHFVNEEELLASLPADRLEEIYRDGIMPMKFNVDAEYMASATFVSDLRLILTTLLYIFRRPLHGVNGRIRQRLLTREDAQTFKQAR